MTKKKERNTLPYTMNAAMVAFVGFDEPLMKVLNKFFDDEEWPRISERVLQAMTKHGIDCQDRKKANEQRIDQHELIECMKEVESRLFPWHIPQPILSAVRSAYAPITSLGIGPSEEYIRLLRSGADQKALAALNESEVEKNTLRGKECLKEEIRDLLLRMRRLRELFEAAPIPAPDRTNPGKPERKKLMDELAAIFDEFTGDSYEESGIGEKARDRSRFVREVLAVFHIPAPRQ